MPVDDLWFLADRATQVGERAYHRLDDGHDEYLACDQTRDVCREQFERVAERVAQSGAPFGAHTVVYRDGGELLLVYHEGVDKWVVPGGGVHPEESFREAAERELAEEAGVAADYDGLALLGRIDVHHGSYAVTGALPVFAAEARTHEPAVEDPDGEITAAEWFDVLPEDTRDREDLRQWRDRALPV
ncbi:NUDIX domain-containing protein [Halorubellus litoreus]|uniref:NUDIX domain-containing protein n=1 Tax=Halorubellus litoreus TaxID=755308 RepID=A0ABD5VIB1_9EURY